MAERLPASTTGLDHVHLEAQVASDVGAAGVGLVVPAPDRPFQAVGDGVFVVAVEVEESTDFGEGERDQASAGGCCGFTGFGFDCRDWLPGVQPLFLALCAVTARKLWARTANPMWRCQAFQVRTW
jgi:hypothetical protein